MLRGCDSRIRVLVSFDRRLVTNSSLTSTISIDWKSMADTKTCAAARGKNTRFVTCNKPRLKLVVYIHWKSMVAIRRYYRPLYSGTDGHVLRVMKKYRFTQVSWSLCLSFSTLLCMTTTGNKSLPCNPLSLIRRRKPQGRWVALVELQFQTKSPISHFLL